MKNINRIFYRVSLIFLTFFFAEAKSEVISVGASNAKVVVKVFSSLTCPACANFHSQIYYPLKKDFIDKNLVRFEHHPFPLDLAALNAEIILRCNVDNNKRFQLLGKIYKKQRVWAIGSDIIKINDSIKKIGTEIDLSNKKMDECLQDDKVQDKILSQRIEAQKKYKIDSTPTIIVNEKKYSTKVDYEKFKKVIEKNL